MAKKILTICVGVLFLCSAPAFANEVLLKKHNCVACHAIDKKVVGPAYKDVAKKYASDPGAATALSKKIKAGGSGVWGAIPMPPHPQISDQEVQSLVTFILGLK